jgi:hypothetical protein
MGEVEIDFEQNSKRRFTDAQMTAEQTATKFRSVDEGVVDLSV